MWVKEHSFAPQKTLTWQLPRHVMIHTSFRSESSLILQIWFNNPKGNVYSTEYSQAVTHPSTNSAQCCLTAVIRRELVFSTWYGRRHKPSFTHDIFPIIYDIPLNVEHHFIKYCIYWFHSTCSTTMNFEIHLWFLINTDYTNICWTKSLPQTLTFKSLYPCNPVL